MNGQDVEYEDGENDCRRRDDFGSRAAQQRRSVDGKHFDGQGFDSSSLLISLLLLLKQNKCPIFQKCFMICFVLMSLLAFPDFGSYKGGQGRYKMLRFMQQGWKDRWGGVGYLKFYLRSGP